MSSSRREKLFDPAQNFEPLSDDGVLMALRQAETHYREMYQRLEQQRAHVERDQARVREENESLLREIVAQRRELEEERRRAERLRERADALAAAVNEIHQALFDRNIYDLILKTCLTLTGATRGLYITMRATDEPGRVRAAVDVGDYPQSPPSQFLAGLCRTVLDSERVYVCNDISTLPGQPPASEAFRNCVAAPVVLLANLSGVIVVGDKVSGDFDEQDAEVLMSVGSQAAVAVENARLQREVQEAYLGIVAVLAETIGSRGLQPPGHDEAAVRCALAVAERLGLPERDRSIVYYAALLRHVGNIGVSDGVLNKPGPLLNAERDLVRAHVQIGADLIRRLPVLEPVAEIVLHHHERYDGSGYPDGIKGDAIPLAARIVSVVDAYYAMLAQRSNRPALSEEDARQELRRGAGTQFDPRVVEAFLAALGAPTGTLDGDERSPVTLPSLV
jgi:HD-GYP domain-containing protein (c-di-GMP phosphodiesterase class II)